MMSSNINTISNNQGLFARLGQKACQLILPAFCTNFSKKLFESYRQSRKYGWSRPWNKENLSIFQCVNANKESQEELFELAFSLLQHDVPMPSSAQHFIAELFTNRDKLQAHLLFHDHNLSGSVVESFEGVTLSIGRQLTNDTYDRVDIVFEAAISAGKSQSLTRLRVYIDPYTGTQEPLWSIALKEKLSGRVILGFETLAAFSWADQQPVNQFAINEPLPFNILAQRPLPLQMSYFYRQQLTDKPLQPRTTKAA